MKRDFFLSLALVGLGYMHGLLDGRNRGVGSGALYLVTILLLKVNDSHL